MADFLRLAVLERTRFHTENLSPEWVPSLMASTNVIKFPDSSDPRIVAKIATRACLPDSRYVYRIRHHDFDPHNNTWYDQISTGSYTVLPVYKSGQEVQFQKFLLEKFSSHPNNTNPYLIDVRKYCIRHPIPRYLFRGTVCDGENILGPGPGVPYWVGIPRDGTVPVKTSDPNLIRSTKMWYRMGLTWLGSILFE